jgi:outer membrane protein OmpA-like peptidoglycan-associated protein
MPTRDANAATPGKPETPAAPPAYVFTAVKAADGSTTMTGNAPSANAKRYLGVVASDVNTDGLAVAANAPASFMADALKGLDALSDLETGTLKFDGKAWSLAGKATTPANQAAASAIIAGLPDAASWTTDIQGPPPLALCKQSLAAFNALNQITFVSGTKLTSGSSAALDTLAADLKVCPKARVDVEGNTDSDGDANLNMALSVARAEAVAAELVKRGIDPERLYAIGYGETLPLVPNTTAKNKALNRRVAVEVEAPDGGK